MKTSFPHKFNVFAYASAQRKVWQSWNPLLKLSVERKKAYKSQKTFFSMEYGRILSKRVLWQTALSQGLFPQSSWPLFRSLLLHKLWMFNNPSLVPGVAWPVKSKKSGVTQLKAFKVLLDLTGHPSQKFLKTTLQKLKHLASPGTPGTWNLASGLDSLKSMVLLKSGWVSTHAAAFPRLTLPQSQNNGKPTQNNMKKKNNFHYVADLWNFAQPPYGEEPTLLWSLLFSAGPGKGSGRFSQDSSAKVYVCMYQHKPFLWVKDFYKQGVFILEKKKGKKTLFAKKPFQKTKSFFFCSLFQPKNGQNFFQRKKIFHFLPKLHMRTLGASPSGKASDFDSDMRRFESFCPRTFHIICSKNISVLVYFMAQKIFPRSLRSGQQLSQDYAFYSEQAYTCLWAKGYELMHQFISFSQKNLLYKNKRKSSLKKKPSKKKKLSHLLSARLCLTNKTGYFQVSPVLFKFAHKSVAKKYNPLKTTHKTRRLGQKEPFKKSLLAKKKGSPSGFVTSSHIPLVFFKPSRFFGVFIIFNLRIYWTLQRSGSVSPLENGPLGFHGKMAERFKAPTWKVGFLFRIVGSNPALSDGSEDFTQKSTCFL